MSWQKRKKLQLKTDVLPNNWRYIYIYLFNFFYFFFLILILRGKWAAWSCDLSWNMLPTISFFGMWCFLGLNSHCWFCRLLFVQKKKRCLHQQQKNFFFLRWQSNPHKWQLKKTSEEYKQNYIKVGYLKSQIENFFSLVCLGTSSKIIYITVSLTFHETVIETQMLMNEIKVILLQYT